ncbi:response regulator receiver domain protein, partial [Ostertagia ostertagi]
MLNTLIVDDEEDSRSSLQHFLTKYCPTVRIVGTAASVQEALVIIRNYPPDLVFLDINMPYENGFELFRTLPAPDFHTIFVTAYEEYALKAIKHHALDYILKPVNITELMQAVNRAEGLADKQIVNRQISNLLQSMQRLQTPEKINIPLADGFLYVPVQDIIRCEAESSYTDTTNMRRNALAYAARQFAMVRPFNVEFSQVAPYRYTPKIEGVTLPENK